MCQKCVCEVVMGGFAWVCVGGGGVSKPGVRLQQMECAGVVSA